MDVIASIYRKLTSKNNLLIIGIIFFSGLLFKEALFGFFSHDDFFCFSISKPDNFKQVLHYFNLAKPHDVYGFYRPLTTQIFYLIGRVVFQMNPFFMHAVSFLTFFITIYLVHKLAKLLIGDEKIALITALLYGASATNFTRLYYFGNYQQLGLGLFFFASLVSYVVFLNSKSMKNLLLSTAFFILALMSHESAVILPGILFLVNLYACKRSAANIIKPIIIFFVIALIYLYLHTFIYGFTKGDSYIYDFSPRVLNTFAWYINWSLNLPEMLVDYMGPALKINQNLFRFYGREIVPILLLFFSQLLILFYLFIKQTNKNFKLLSFCLAWFLIGILTVLFLPLHKFSYYTTIAMFGLYVAMSQIITSNKRFAVIFLMLFIITSLLTKELTIKTNWITQGSRAAEKTKVTLDAMNLSNNAQVCFYDLKEDDRLPWKPSEQLKIVLSDNNFFQVFYHGNVVASYTICPPDDKVIKISAGEMLSY